MGTILLGVLTGIWLRRPKSLSAKAVGLLVGSISGLVLGNIWNIWFPINKKLWTSSYVLFAAGLHFVAARHLFLCSRDQAVDARLDISLAGVRIQRYYGICLLGASRRRALHHPCAPAGPGLLICSNSFTRSGSSLWLIRRSDRCSTQSPLCLSASFRCCCCTGRKSSSRSSSGTPLMSVFEDPLLERGRWLLQCHQERRP